MRPSPIALLLLALTCPLAAQTARESHAGHTVSFDIPEGYEPLQKQAPFAAELLFGYRKSRRADCMSGTLVVTLVDLPGIEGGDTISLQQFAATMLRPVEAHRSDWVVRDSSVVVAGVEALRYTWSGTAATPHDSPCKGEVVQMRGVFIVGIADSLGFTLQARDRQANAAKTLADAESAWQTLQIQ
jgi:hypothetical protein